MKLINKILDENEFKIIDHSITTFTNPFSYLKLRNRPDLIKEIDHIYIDGVLLLLVLQIFGIRKQRYSMDMTSVFPKILDYCIEKNLTIFLIGSTEEEIKLFIEVIAKEFPKLQIAGYRNGYFTDKDKEKFLQEFVEINPDVVVCGMGTPVQESFLIDLKRTSWKGFGYTCGGFIHQTSKGLHYYPAIFDKLNIRWIYRLIDEPKLVVRYFFYYPYSILFFIKDLVLSKSKKIM